MALNRIFTPQDGDRPNAPNIILLITDGVPNPYDPDELEATVNAVKATGARIVGVGIGDGVNDDIMRSIVSSPASDNYFQLANFNAITAMLERIVQQTCIVCGEPTTPAPQPCK